MKGSIVFQFSGLLFIPSKNNQSYIDWNLLIIRFIISNKFPFWDRYGIIVVCRRSIMDQYLIDLMSGSSPLKSILECWMIDYLRLFSNQQQKKKFMQYTQKKFYFLVYWFDFFVGYLSVCRKKLDNSTLHANMIPKIIFRYILQSYFELEIGDHPVSCYMPRGNRHVNTTDVDFNISFESLH